jgi:tRNA pseudouridine38-40 synthase
MPSFKIVVAYDGTDFVGWQRQATGVSIQSLLEDALRTLDDRDVTVAAAGRTDAGVHALGQVAAFTLERAIDSATLVRALNAQLPDSVRALSATEVPAMFNPRFNTRAKTYRYRIWNGPVLSPFERRYAWHVFGTLDVGAMAAAARRLEGRHDFASFQAAGSDVTTTERTILSSKLSNDNHSLEKLSMNKLSTTEDAGDTEEKSFSRTTRTGTGFNLRVPRVPSGGEICGGDLICYEITGDGFLRHMVRAVAGTLVEIGRGRRPVEWIDEVLASRDRAAAGPTAPAAGLFLIAVHYGDAPCE